MKQSWARKCDFLVTFEKLDSAVPQQYVVDMVPEEAKEFTEKIRDANVRYDRALTRLGNEGLNLEEIDRTISEVTRAHQDVTDALQRLRELIVMS